MAGTTLIPLPSTSFPTKPPQVPVLYDETAMSHAAALSLPPCTRPIDCTNQTNRIPPPLPWWVPVGTVRATHRAFKAYFHISQLGDLKSPVSTTVKTSLLDLTSREDLRQLWLATSKTQLEAAMKRYALQAPNAFGTDTTLTPTKMSIAEFLAKEPTFTVKYLDIGSDVQPTESELTSANGLAAFTRRGGLLMHIPTLEGEIPLKRITLWACAEWCRGCVTDYWPAGVPTCLQEIKVETDNFDWGMFARRLPNLDTEITIKRLPKGTWDHIEDGIRTVTDQLDRFIEWMCARHREGTDQAVAAATLPVADPATAAGVVAANAVLDRGCGVSTVATTTTNYVPGQTPIPLTPIDVPTRFTAIKEEAIKRAARNQKIAAGVAAFGLAVIGGYALTRKRRR